MKKIRLDNILVMRKIVATRSQAESYIKLGQVKVNGQVVTKPGYFIQPTDKVIFAQEEQYVSRAALKLASVVSVLNLDFRKKTILDVGSSTGGFSDYALRQGAHKVFAVDVGTDQLHPSLCGNPRIELHEKTDIRNFAKPKAAIDIALVDVSFISLREVLPAVAKLVRPGGQIVAMVKPQFEAGQPPPRHASLPPGKARRSAGLLGSDDRFSPPVLSRSSIPTASSVPRGENGPDIQARHRLDKYLSHGVIKNDKLRRKILHDFEVWGKKHFVTGAKADSAVTGAKGNRERFYLLTAR